jgi:hypothetical protein
MYTKVHVAQCNGKEISVAIFPGWRNGRAQKKLNHDSAAPGRDSSLDAWVPDRNSDRSEKSPAHQRVKPGR